MTNPYTAEITARGAASHVPGNQSAADATISYLGAEVGHVTLVENQLGQLDTWGSVGNWADDDLRRHMVPQVAQVEDFCEIKGCSEDLFDIDDLTDRIVLAVREAAR